MEPCTPAFLFSLYRLLTPEQQIDFLKLVASISTAKEPLMMIDEMPRRERRKFTDLTTAKVVEGTLPLLVRTACKLVRENPRLLTEPYEQELERSFREWGDAAAREISAMEREQLKEQRDRKSRPETIKRNVEICDLRKTDPKKWSLGMLGKKFHITKQAIKKILEEESKWRRLAVEG